ncbi:EF-hand calcium-binding domain-containing protein 6 isoform X3 [Castor canadensis]|uniref:EF-hand calcium-binding domain-containing protein 6 isoform X3 n=1 Tax=Castor canadensis TaxID=51338 RepID=A0AC58NGL8_CASCN
MRRNSTPKNAILNSTKSGSTQARELMRKMAIIPDWHTLYPHIRKFTHSRPYSSPCRVDSRNGSQSTFRSSSSSTTAFANPTLSFLDVERILFQKITDKRDELKKVFELLDVDQNLTVTKSELRGAITTFLLPLTREQFQDVLAQIPLTSSGNVPYLEFLSRFGGINLNINCMKRGGESEMNCCRTRVELEAQVGEKVFRNMKTILKAFKLIDVNNTGLVQPPQLRRVLDAFCLKMKDEEYEMFAKHYNIDKDTAVNYNDFLKNLGISNDLNLRYFMGNQEVLRENQYTKSSKREQLRDSLSSEDVWKNFSLDDIQRIFCQELSKSYGKIEKALSAGDPSKGGYVSLNYLKVVLDTFVYRLPRRIFIQLMRRFGLKTTTRINWKQFLTTFYEFQGLEVSNAVPLKKRDSITSRSRSHKENIIKKIFRYSEDRFTALRKALLIMSTTPAGQITWEELRHILNCMVVNLSDSEFKELIEAFDPEGRGVVRVSSFMDLLEGSPKMSKSSPSTDTKAPVYMAWDSVEEKVYDTITRNFRAFYNMLHSYDLGDTGLIGQNNFKKIVHIFCPFLTDEHLMKFCDKFYSMASGGILYKSLLACVGTDGPPAVSPVLVPRDQPSEGIQKEERQHGELPERAQSVEDNTARTKNMTKEEVIEKLKTCIQLQDPTFRERFLNISKELDGKIDMRDFRKNFIETDSDGHGILRRRDVKNALYGFDIPLTPREFEKLWQSYDTQGRGYITYQEFLQKLGITYSPEIHRPYTEDYFNFLGHFTKPQQIQEEIQELHQIPDKTMPARDRLIEHYQDISKALSTQDNSKTGSISLFKMQKVLQECLCPLKEEELTHLLHSWGISLHENSFNYFDFLRALESSMLPRSQSREKEESMTIDFSTLNPEDIVQSIQQLVEGSQLALLKAFSAVDKEDTGFIKAAEFGQVLKDFCHKLTDNQYHYFLRKARLHLMPCIHWKYFLQNFGSFLEEAADEWAEKMPKASPRSPREVANRDILARLHRAVTAHYHAIAQEFENFDTMKNNTASRDEFRAICTRHVQILTDEQFDRLWSKMPINAKGRLKYQDFLSQFSTEKPPSPPALGDPTAAHRGSSAPEVSEGTRSPSRDLRTGLKSRSHPCTPASTMLEPGTPPLQNCEPIESKLRKQIQGCWHELLRECKERDVDRQGGITAPEFLALVEKFNLDISKEESQQLIMKYDLKNNGKFAYCDFIQSCVLLLKAKETSLMQRMKIQNAHKMKEAGAETSSFYSALLRIQPKILHCWRPMRRTFKTYDEGGTGLLSAADFRKVLRQYSINLSEEEFFHVLEYYDKALSSKISYNDFLRAFLQ